MTHTLVGEKQWESYEQVGSLVLTTSGMNEQKNIKFVFINVGVRSLSFLLEHNTP